MPGSSWAGDGNDSSSSSPRMVQTGGHASFLTIPKYDQILYFGIQKEVLDLSGTSDITFTGSLKPLRISGEPGQHLRLVF